MKQVTLCRMRLGDVGFVFECLKELRGEAEYSQEKFESFVLESGLIGHQDFQIFIGMYENREIGMLTCNRFAMPRYLGFGFELEEVIIHPAYQGDGYGKALVQAFLDHVSHDQSVRKVIVKTDDEIRAGGVYRHFFHVVQTKLYGKYIHRL